MDREHRQQEAQAKLDRAYEVLEEHAPDRIARAIRWLRNPEGRKVRLPLGIALVLVSFAGPVMPIVGIEWLPLGLLLIAQDVPPLRGPVADMTLWAEAKWLRWRQRRRQRSHP